MTPVKKSISQPSAPVKNKYYNNIPVKSLQSVKRKLDNEFDTEDHEQILDKIEAMMDEEDRHIISIDGRYVQSLEHHIGDLQQTARQWASEAYQYFIDSGLNQNKICVMQDEIDSLKAQVALLEDMQLNNMV
jgi:polyhydroxyalkanoate synthesis regulator phasin